MPLLHSLWHQTLTKFMAKKTTNGYWGAQKNSLKDHDEKLWEMTSPQHVPYPYNPYVVYLPTFGWLSMVIKCIGIFCQSHGILMGIWVRNLWVPFSSIPNPSEPKKSHASSTALVLAEKNSCHTVLDGWLSHLIEKENPSCPIFGVIMTKHVETATTYNMKRRLVFLFTRSICLNLRSLCHSCDDHLSVVYWIPISFREWMTIPN